MQHRAQMHAYFHRLLFSALLFGICAGCNDNTEPTEQAQLRTVAESRQVFSQGKLMPATGITSLSALPGDQFDSILVKDGQLVAQGDVLIVMRSNQIKQIELQAAQTKLADAKIQEKAKKTEVRLALEAADLKLEQAKLTEKQAKRQREIASSGNKSIDTLRSQIERLKKLKSDVQLQNMIGQSDIDLKEIELQKAEQQVEVNIMAADQAVETTAIAVKLAEQARSAADENSKLFNQSTAIEALEKQIELLQLQMETTRIIAPSNSTVLNVRAAVGESAGPTPVVDVADLSNMICIAEVHEADVARLSIGDRASLSSAALPHAIGGKIIRIDTLVGAPQMRLPNPLARSDFRAVPVRIEIDKADQSIAAKLVQLQVDVTITPAGASSKTTPVSSPAS